jgi:GTPase involved in cell partitioning and DNA repair
MTELLKTILLNFGFSDGLLFLIVSVLMFFSFYFVKRDEAYLKNIKNQSEELIKELDQLSEVMKDFKNNMIIMSTKIDTSNKNTETCLTGRISQQSVQQILDKIAMIEQILILQNRLNPRVKTDFEKDE